MPISETDDAPAREAYTVMFLDESHDVHIPALCPVEEVGVLVVGGAPDVARAVGRQFHQPVGGEHTLLLVGHVVIVGESVAVVAGQSAPSGKPHQLVIGLFDACNDVGGQSVAQIECFYLAGWLGIAQYGYTYID